MRKIFFVFLLIIIFLFFTNKVLLANNYNLTCQKKYYCKIEPNFSCELTSSNYDNNFSNCDNINQSCHLNLGIFLPAQTTGICYHTKEDCLRNCSSSFSLPSLYFKSLPITGTFLAYDYEIFSNDILNSVYREMRELGIDTVIFLVAGGWYPDSCNPSENNEVYYFTPGSWYFNNLKEAYNQRMNIFFGLVDTDIFSCTPFWQKNYQDKILNYSKKLINKLKQTITSQGWSWNDSIFKGFYVYEQGISVFEDVNSSDSLFWKELVKTIKSTEPNKLVLMSPWLLEKYDYRLAKKAYLNLYNFVGIDILAPQDSMGTLKVTSYEKSKELFKALNDALKESGSNKLAWANVETFTQDDFYSKTYYPSTIDKVSKQIETVKPYVSKIITWIYQNTMLVNKFFINHQSWSNQYTPINATKREKLRSEYINNYGCKKKFFCIPSQGYSCVQTNSDYDNDFFQCNLTNQNCSGNIKKYHPGKTTGQCYHSLDDCLKNCNQSISLVGDVDGDKIVSFKDYFYALRKKNNFPLPSYFKFDFNNDNLFDEKDFNLIINIVKEIF